MKRQNKAIRVIGFFLVMLTFSALFAGCVNNGAQPAAPDNSAPAAQDEPAKEEPAPSEPAEEPEKEEPAPDGIELSEIAMENFLKNVESGNYVIDAKDFLKTTAYSRDLVCFDYYDDEIYNDFAVMSVDNEVFQGMLDDKGVTEAAFIGEGDAMDAARSRLLNYWLAEEVSQGNIYNLFYNDVDQPLRFVSYEDIVKQSVASFMGYGENAVPKMHEVYLTLNEGEPTSAHIEAVIDDDEVARIFFDDVDLTVTFGFAEADPRAEAWMKAPEYPQGRTGWTEGDIFVFNSVFLPGYGEAAIPFIPSASYALMIDEENFVFADEVNMRDSHATKEDVEAYIAVLEENGFEAVEEDSKTWYRKLLREETKCYSSICAEYNDGLDIVAKKYYDFPVFDGFDAINKEIAAHKYPKLQKTDELTEFYATETKFEATESWLYFYDYETVLYVYAKYNDYDRTVEYLEDYAAGLVKKGYEPVYAVDAEDGEVDHYKSPDESRSFRYHFEDDDETVILLFKAEKTVSSSEAEKIIKKGGFPAIDLKAMDSCRDHTKFQKVQYGKDYKAVLTLSVSFENEEKADAFLGKYVEKLENDDFMRMPPSEMGSNKTNAYIKEEAGLGVAFDFIPGEGDAPTQVFFDFRIE